MTNSVNDGSDSQEEEPLCHGMVQDMNDAAGQARLVRQAHSKHDVTDLCDRRVGQHPFNAVLVECKE